MPNELTAGIVRILNRVGSTPGTGFVVSTDGLIATCAHVVRGAGAGPGDTVRVAFHATGEEREAQVEPNWWRGPDAEDVAILRLDGPVPEGVTPLPLGISAGVEGHTLTTFGFPDPKPVEGMAGKCEVVGRTTERGFPVLQLRSSEVTPGFSGAPVLDTVTRRVVGMVTAITVPDQYGRLPETAFITPTETLRAVCPVLQLSDLCPYRGLAAFTEDHAEFFFGREKLVADLVAHLQGNPRFLAVVGPSGSGKSSVVRAGLFPALRRGKVSGSEEWHLLPFRPGANPFAALTTAGLEVPQKGDLPAAIHAFLETHPQVKRLVLFADQFEELFTLCPQPVQEQFLRQLAALLESDLSVTLVLTLRADFYGHLLRYRPLVDWLKIGQVNVPPMGPEELQAAVEEPATRLGLRFEPGLVETIVEEAGTAEHPLPLLESALTQLWERREDGVLTHAAYQAAGQVAGAIGQWAEDAYTELAPQERPLARRVFTRLVRYGEGEVADTRQQQSLSELVTQTEEREPLHRLVQRLADARLLVTGGDLGAKTVEIVHDALLQQWGRLKHWTAEQREFYLWRQRLDERLQEWEEKGQDKDALLRGALLVEAERWRGEQSDELNVDEQAYIRESVALRKREQMAREQLRQRVILGLALGLAVTIALALVAWTQRNQYREQRQTALSRQLAAQSVSRLSDDNWDLALLLAVEAVRTTRTVESISALHHVLAYPGHTLTILHSGASYVASWSPDESRIVTGDSDGTVYVWDAETGAELLTLSAHTDAIWQATWNADGDRLLTASRDNTGRVWDIATGEQLLSLPGQAAVWSIDGSRILTADHYGTARVWSAETGEELLTLTGHQGDVWQATWSTDEDRILTASSDHTARVWDAETGEELLTLVGHESYVRRATWSTNEDRILTVSDDGTARVWDADTGEELLTLVGGRYYYMQAAWSADVSRFLTSGGDGRLRVWDADTGEQLLALPHYAADIVQATWNVDGSRILTAGDDDSARVWDAETGEELLTLSGHENTVLQAVWSADESRILTSSEDGTQRVWSTGSELLTFSGHTGDINQITWNMDRSRILTASSDRTARVWDAKTGAELLVLSGHTSDVLQAVWNADETGILTVSNDGTARVWDAETGAGLATFSGHTGDELITLSGKTDTVEQAMWSGDGSRILTVACTYVTGHSICEEYTVHVWDVETGKALLSLSGEATGRWRAMWDTNESRILTWGIYGPIRVWDAATGEEQLIIYDHKGVSEVAWNPDESRIMAWSFDSDTTYVWDAETGERQFTFSGGVPAWNSDGSTLLIADDEHVVRVWDLQTKETVLTLPGHTAAWSADETRILTRGPDHMMRVWDAKTGEELASLSLNTTGEGFPAVWSTDGSRVLTWTSDDDTVRVWDVTTGVEMFTISGYTGNIDWAAWGPDESRILVMDHDGTARQCYAQTEDLLEKACQCAPRNMTLGEWQQYIGDEPYRPTCPNLPGPEE